MARSPVLIPVVVVVSLMLRALPRPVYLGRLDPAADSLLGVAAPFGDDLKGSSDAFLSLQARSLLREGLSATGGVPLFNVSKADPKDFWWYGHHPPGVALVTALAFGAFGESELVARGVALLFSTVTLAALVAAVRRLAGDVPAIAAAVGVCAPPLGWYWGSHLDYQAPTLAAVTVFLIAALREPSSRRDRIVAATVLALGVALDFLAVLAVPALAAARTVARPRRARATVGYGLVAAGAAVLVIAWLGLATSRHGRSPGGDLAAQVAAVWSLPPGVGVGDFLRAIGRHLFERAGIAPLAGLVVGTAAALAGRGPLELRRLLLGGLAFAALAGLLPRTRAYDHPYFQIPWLLPIGAAFALAAVAARSVLRVEPRTEDLVLGFDWKRGVPALALAVAVMTEGWDRSVTLRPEERRLPRVRIDSPRRPVAPDDRPSAALLGRELSRAVPSNVKAIALPAASRFAVFVPSFYAGRVVLRLEQDEKRAGIAPVLSLLGLSDAEVWLARNSLWPGRDGFEPLTK